MASNKPVNTSILSENGILKVYANGNFLAGFSTKVPLFHFISPLNILVDSQIKYKLEELLPIAQSLVYFILGLDPIVLIASKQN